MKRILIVGGGAAGLAAAISAAKTARGAQVVVLEGQDRLGKKILATGNGRCNLGNQRVLPAHYETRCPDRLRILLKNMPAEATPRFFEQCGLLCTPDEEGRLYPYCRQASMVLDVLLLTLRQAGADVETGARVTELTAKDGVFTAVAANGMRWCGDAVILAAGGKAAAKQEGYALAKAFGHHMAPLYPCLVPLRCAHPALKGLKGIRAHCGVSIERSGRRMSEVGELQFTEYGISGIPAMQLSRGLGSLQAGEHICARIDFFPEWDLRQVYEMLCARIRTRAGETLETVFLGLIHKRLLYAVLKGLSTAPLSRPAVVLQDEELRALAAALKAWPMEVTGTLSWEHAQVTGGGVVLDEVDDCLQSRLQPGLYLAGEMLDVAGMCGGYNLHWAWCSGILAGTAAARRKTK